MARYELGILTSAASAGAAYANLAAGATYPLRLLEVGVWNTTTTACDASIARATANGTASTSASGVDEQTGDAASTGVVASAWSVAPTLSTSYMRRGKLAAAIGSGYIWSWVYPGIFIPVSTGLALINATGTGQICSCYFIWDE
jgi:hypothetical protein